MSTTETDGSLLGQSLLTTIPQKAPERYDRFKRWKSQNEKKRGEREIKFKVRHIVL
jgi:hypothetical protein